MSDCPNGEYFSVTLQQCMDHDSFINYLATLAGPGRTDLLQQERSALGESNYQSLIKQNGGLLGDDPLGIKGLFDRLANSIVSILVIVVGLVLVGLAVNAWLNEQGTGVKSPVKFK